MNVVPPAVAALERRFELARGAEQPTLALELAWQLRYDDPPRSVRLAALAAADPALAEAVRIVDAAARRRLDPASVSHPPGECPAHGPWLVRWTLLDVHCGLTRVDVDLPDLERRLRAAVDVAGNLDLDARDRAQLENALGRVAYRQDDPIRAAQHFRSAGNRFAAIGDPKGESVALVNLGNSLSDLDDLGGALESYEAALDKLGAFGTPYELTLLHLNLGVARLRLGDFDEARRYGEIAAESSDTLGTHPIRIHVLVHLASAAFLAEDWVEVRRIADRASALGEVIDDGGFALALDGYRAVAMAKEGSAEAALELLDELALRPGQQMVGEEPRLHRATVLAELGRHQQVVDLLQPIVDQSVRSLAYPRDWAVGALADALLALGRCDEAARLLLEHVRRSDERRRRLQRQRIADRSVQVDLASARVREHIARDERQVLREQLVQAQRLEAVGQLASGVAHDFNNLLTVILGEGDAIVHHPDAPAEVVGMSRNICDAADRAGGLTRQLLAFARKAPMAAGPVDLAGIVTAARPMISAALGRRVALVVEIPDRPMPPVLGDPALLEQVVLNLALNARDAMQDGGSLYISARPRGTAGADIVVRDTGTGIPAAVLERIFEPFFTTKGPSQGSGLGLAMVWGVVQQLGGTVRVHSCVGEGTEFVVQLAAVDPAADPSNGDPVVPA
jgi:signal transduction histidine kinase